MVRAAFDVACCLVLAKPFTDKCFLPGNDLGRDWRKPDHCSYVPQCNNIQLDLIHFLLLYSLFTFLC
jgi:hypothetical protein